MAALASKQSLMRVALLTLLAGGAVYAVPQMAPAGADNKQVKGPSWYLTLHYITLLCGTRSLMAMESRAIAGGLSAADH
jgi:hypothetical protein